MSDSRANRWIALLGLTVLAGALIGATVNAETKSDDKAQIKALEEQLSQAFAAKDVDKIMSFYSPGDDLFVFDLIPPRQYVGAAAWRKDFEDFFATAGAGPTTVQIADLDITNDGRIAFAHYTSHIVSTDKSGAKVDLVMRTTDCLRQIKGKWLIVHEHNSVPVDVATAKADLASKP
jgi:uncharacterized protein (TIGR02246 family)